MACRPVGAKSLSVSRFVYHYTRQGIIVNQNSNRNSKAFIRKKSISSCPSFCLGLNAIIRNHQRSWKHEDWQLAILLQVMVVKSSTVIQIYRWPSPGVSLFVYFNSKDAHEWWNPQINEANKHTAHNSCINMVSVGMSNHTQIYFAYYATHDMVKIEHHAD